MPEETLNPSVEAPIEAPAEEVLSENAPVESVPEEVAVESAPKDIVLEDPSSDGYNTPSEVRIKELDAVEQLTPDYSQGCKVWKGEELVTIFTKERDGVDFVEKAKLWAEVNGYEVK